MHNLRYVRLSLFFFVAAVYLSQTQARAQLNSPNAGATSLNNPRAFPVEPLVQGEVIAVEEKSGLVIGQVRVTHVYCGPTEWLGQEFQQISLSGQGSTATAIFPRLSLGDKGVWALVRGSKDELQPSRDSIYGSTLPSREKIDNRYEQTKAMASAVEEAYKAEPQAQLELLRSFATSKIPEISIWAIRFLGEMAPGESGAYLTQFLQRDQLTVFGQVAADEVLAKVQGKEWQQSKERLQLMKNWVNGELNELEARKVLERLDLVNQRWEIDHETYLDLLRAGESNTKMPEKIRPIITWYIKRELKINPVPSR